MGEYIQHEKLLGLGIDELKIGVCQGGEPKNWRTWFSKESLVVLKDLGFVGNDEEPVGDSKIINSFIEHYNEMDTVYMKFSNLVEISIPTQPEAIPILKQPLIDRDVLILLPVGEKIIYVTDAHYMQEVIEVAAELEIADHVYFRPISMALAEA